MAEPNLASSMTAAQQKGQNAQKVKAQHCAINECYSNQWQTKYSTHLCFLLGNYIFRTTVLMKAREILALVV